MFQWVRIFSRWFCLPFHFSFSFPEEMKQTIGKRRKKSKRSLKGHVFGKQVTWLTYNLLSVNVEFLPHHFSWALAKYRFPVYEDILGIEPKNKYLQISKTYQKKKFIENWFVIVFTGLVISFHNPTPPPCH